MMAEEMHTPWTATPPGRGSEWLVKDCEGKVIALGRSESMAAYIASIPEMMAAAETEIERLRALLMAAPIPSQYGAGVGEYDRLATDLGRWRAQARAALSPTDGEG